MYTVADTQVRLVLSDTVSQERFLKLIQKNIVHY